MLLLHRTDAHIDTNRALERWTASYPWQNGDQIDETLKEVLVANRGHIFKESFHCELYSTFNYALHGSNLVTEVHRVITETRLIIQSSCKLNLALGCVLEHRETGELRYFVAGDKFPMMKHPVRIDRQSDWQNVFTKIIAQNIEENINLQRSDTKRKMRLVTNVNINVWYLNVVMGYGDLPEYVMRNKNIVTLVYDSKGNFYTDNACAARCLAYHRLSEGGRKPQSVVNRRELQKMTNQIQSKWNRNGVNIADIDLFGKMLEISIDIISLQPDGSVDVKYESLFEYKEKMTLNLHESHLSYCTNPQALKNKFLCPGCHRHFTHLGNLKKTQRLLRSSYEKVFHFDHF